MHIVLSTCTVYNMRILSFFCHKNISIGSFQKQKNFMQTYDKCFMNEKHVNYGTLMDRKARMAC